MNLKSGYLLWDGNMSNYYRAENEDFGNNTEATIIDKPEQIELWNLLVLRSALKLEMLGLKISRGKTAYSVIKQMFNLKGNRQRVLDTFNEIIKQQQQGEA